MFGSAALPLLTPALTLSVVVAPPPAGPDDACPSSRQVAEAMHKYGQRLKLTTISVYGGSPFGQQARMLVPTEAP